jgi:class 3 adenylate cyclase
VAEAALVRYVYIDIVDFTRERSVEAQSEIITALGQLVNQAIGQLLSEPRNVLFLPTGDGLCICLINLIQPFDLDIQIALAVLQQLHQRNQKVSDPSRRFAVRIGINENQDNLITDIRGSVNVVGLGINMAQRVMSVAGPSRLLLGPAVAQRLQQRELYRHWLRPVQAIIKHGEKLRCHEYFNPSLACFAQLEPLKASRPGASPVPPAAASVLDLPMERGSRGRRSAPRRQPPPPSFQISP